VNPCTSSEPKEPKLPTISIRLTREELRAQRLHELASIFESAFNEVHHESQR
jgi:hypothetical protein